MVRVGFIGKSEPIEPFHQLRLAFERMGYTVAYGLPFNEEELKKWGEVLDLVIVNETGVPAKCAEVLSEKTETAIVLHQPEHVYDHRYNMPGGKPRAGVMYDEIIETASRCGYVFTAQRGGLTKTRDRGIKTYWLPNGFNPKEYYPIKPLGEPRPPGMTTALYYEYAKLYGSDVCFVGKHVGWIHVATDLINLDRAEFLMKFEEKFGKRFRWWGVQRAIGYVDDPNKVYNFSKVCLNITGEMTGVFTNRLYDIPGARAFLLTNWGTDLHLLYDIGKEIIAYRSVEEALELAEYYIENEEERIKIANAGFWRASEEHTWEKRAQKILEVTGVR